MLKIEAKHTEVAEEQLHQRAPGGEGLLFVAILVMSWLVAIAIGWVIWRLSPL